MKKFIFLLPAVFTIIASFTPHTPAEQKYKMENTAARWQSTLQLIEYTKNVIKNSDVPAKIALPLSDSLTAFQNDIVAQVQPQMPKDTTKKK